MRNALTGGSAGRQSPPRLLSGGISRASGPAAPPPKILKRPSDRPRRTLLTSAYPSNQPLTPLQYAKTAYHIRASGATGSLRPKPCPPELRICYDISQFPTLLPAKTEYLYPKGVKDHEKGPSVLLISLLILSLSGVQAAICASPWRPLIPPPPPRPLLPQKQGLEHLMPPRRGRFLTATIPG